MNFERKEDSRKKKLKFNGKSGKRSDKKNLRQNQM